MRTRNQINADIREKKLELRKLRKKGARSEDVKEVKSINEAMEKIHTAIDDLEDELYKLDLLEDEEENERANDPGATTPFDAKIPSNAVRVGSRTSNSSGSGSSLKGSFGSIYPNHSKLALRSDERMVDRIPMSERKNLDLGKYIRGAVTGDWKGATEERAAFSTTATGVIIPSVLSAQIIDKARELSLFTSAEVPVIPMETNNLTLGRVVSDPVFEFKEELAEGKDAAFTLDSVILNSKTAYGYCYVSLEAINSAANLGDIILQAFGQAMANMIDKAFLYGQGGDTFAPSGIVNDTDINVIHATNSYYSDFIRGIGAVKRNNGNPTILGMNAATEEVLEPGGIDHPESTRNNQSELIRKSQCTYMAN